MKKNIFISVWVMIMCFDLYAQIPDGYYDGTENLTKEGLKIKLHQIIRNHKKFKYEDFRDVILPVLDEDPNNSDNIILFYKNNSIPKSNFASGNDGWNREHTWPKSHGFPQESDTTYTDAHNLRPSDATVNSSKSNKDFDDIDNTVENEQGEAPNTYTNSDFWEPRDEIKGDVARILFYMDVRYESSRLNLELVDRSTFTGDPELGVLYTMIQWHEQDPVDDAERARHEGVFGYQKNRNPFIDHPEWVAQIWGSTSDPSLIADELNFSRDFGQVTLGSSLVQTYTLNARNLIDDVSIEVDEPFSLSTDQTNWTDSIGFTNDNSGDQKLTVYLSFEPQQSDVQSINEVIHYTDGDTTYLEVIGKEGTIQFLTIAEAREKSNGEVVNITGVVIDKGNNSSNSRVVYDGTAGVVVRSFDAGNESSNLTQGDSVIISGGLSEYNNLLQIEESPIKIEIVKQGVSLPAPQVITIDQIGEEYESELVKVEDVSFIGSGVFAGGGSSGNFTISDGTNTTTFRIGSSGHPLVGESVMPGTFDITGFVGQFGSSYQLSPRDLDDLVLLERVLGLNSLTESLIVYPNPASSFFNLKNGSTLSGEIYIIDLNGKIVSKVENVNQSISISHLEEGVYMVVLKNGDKALYTRLLVKK